MTYLHKLAKRLAVNGPWMRSRSPDPHHGISFTLRYIASMLPLTALIMLGVSGCSDAGTTDPQSDSDVVQIHVSPSTLALRPGDRARLTAFGFRTDIDSFPTQVTWSATGGTVSAAGEFTAGSAVGTYHVAATHPERLWLTDSSVVSVVGSGSDVVALRLSPLNPTMRLGDSLELSVVEVTAAGYTQAVSTPTVWTVSAGSLRTDNTGKGRYKPDRPGQHKVAASADSLSDSTVVTVVDTAIAVASVAVTPASATVQVGKTVQLTATTFDAAGNPLSGQPVTWSTSAAAVATVSSGGLVTSKAAGAATITATSNGKTGSASVTVVTVPVASVAVTPSSLALAAGQTSQLTATARDSAGNLLSGRTVTWSTSAPAVASVSGGGLVTAQGSGTATMTATVEDRSATVGTTVSEPVAGQLVFSDGFESGDLSLSMNGNRWLASDGKTGEVPVVSRDIARTGTYSLRFTFLGKPDSTLDSWSEQRFALLDSLQEVYLQWYQYFPDGTEGLGAKFEYRDSDGPDNNKFLRLWDESYTNYAVKVGFSFQLSAWAGDPALITEFATNQNTGMGSKGSQKVSPAITDAQRGRWIRFTVHVRAATAANNDGVIQLWLDGNLVINNTTLAMYPLNGLGNYLRNGYLMGWANSSFAQTTYTYIDDFVILDVPPSVF